MVVDNFDTIGKLINIDKHDLDTFYHLQILRRGKDHPELSSANRMIKAYFIDSNEALDKLKSEIINLCNVFGARAYINLSPKSYKKCSLQTISDMAKRISDGDFKKIYRSWNSVAGYIKSSEPHWIIDVDTKDVKLLTDAWSYAKTLNPNGVKLYATIPTLHGFHIISSAFNLFEFRKKFSDIEIHKNNPTVLYIPQVICDREHEKEIREKQQEIQVEKAPTVSEGKD
jgi:hypothetical protein